MRIRGALPEDAETLHRFICELATYEREPDAVEVTPTDLAGQMAQTPPPFECLLAEEEGEAVGMALFFHTYSTWRGRRGVHLEDLWVRPAARGRGIGGALLKELAALTVKRGCRRLEWSVLDWNELAIGFYQGIGAVPMSGWTTWRLDGDALTQLGQR